MSAVKNSSSSSKLLFSLTFANVKVYVIPRPPPPTSPVLVPDQDSRSDRLSIQSVL